MKKVIKTFLLLLFLVGTFTFHSCQSVSSKEKLVQLQLQNDSLSTAISSRDSIMDNMIATFEQIESDLSFIKEQGNVISLESTSDDLGQNRKDQIIQDVQQLGALLKESRDKLKKLDKQLKSSGVKIASLEKQINELSDNLEQRSVEIIALRDELVQKDIQIASLNIEVNTLQDAQTQNEKIITEQTQKIDNLSQAYFAQGTAKELKDKGLVSTQGGFLGIGKVKTVNQSINPENFSEIDMRETFSIPLNTKDAKLITEHPQGSYEFLWDEEGEEVIALAINNPNEFYRFSRYVVVETN